MIKSFSTIYTKKNFQTSYSADCNKKIFVNQKKKFSIKTLTKTGFEELKKVNKLYLVIHEI